MDKIVNLQLLRAIAALMVVLYHAANLFFKIGGGREGNIFSFFSQFGYAGVDVFFVISGYIIWLSTKKVSGFKGVLAYLYNRTTRIYLGYWPYFFLFLLLAYALSIEIHENVDIWGSLFLTQSYMHKLLIDVTWTLKFELYFYICFAVLLVLPRAKLKWAVLLLTIFLIALQVWYALVAKAYLPDNYYQQNLFFWFYTSPLCLEFLMGCFVAWYFEKYNVKWLGVVFVMSLALFFGAVMYQNSLVNGALSQGYFTIQRVVFYGSGSALFLMGLIELEKRGAVIFKRFSILLGGASYSMYLAHAIILYFITRSGLVNEIKSMGYSPLLMTLLIVLLMILYSVFHYLYIEKPLMHLAKFVKKRLFKPSIDNSL